MTLKEWIESLKDMMDAHGLDQEDTDYEELCKQGLLEAVKKHQGLPHAEPWWDSHVDILAEGFVKGWAPDDVQNEMVAYEVWPEVED